MKPVTRVGVPVAVALACVLVCSPVTAAHDPCATGGCLGPNAPALIDTNENGRPDPGIDLAIVLVVGPTGLIVNSPWQHNALDTDNVISFRNSDLKRDGKFMAFQRSSLSGLSQRVEIDPDSIVSGRPTKFLFTETKLGAPGVTGWAELRDADGDGFHERLVATRVSGTELDFELTFVGADTNGDRHPDFISIPWAQASLLGVARGDGIGPIYTHIEDPQVWLPLADTDADGAPDSIVLDLDGDFGADSKLFWTPRLAMTTGRSAPLVDRGQPRSRIPNSSDMSIGIALVGACLGGWLHLRRRNVLG